MFTINLNNQMRWGDHTWELKNRCPIFQQVLLEVLNSPKLFKIVRHDQLFVRIEGTTDWHPVKFHLDNPIPFVVQ